MLFINNQGTVPTSSGVNKSLRYVLKELGIIKKGFHFHSLRHTHVAYLISQGVDIYAISKRLGHSDMSITTKKYAYFLDEYKAKNDLIIESKLNNLHTICTQDETKSL